MAISIEIEKLEKRWQQTSGLVFAPLAEAYRKAGLQTRALEILEQGLALHAEYAPALIVRARCHLDTGDLGAAEEAFNQALGRDPNDPIALRGLADVFERTGRLPEAIARLRELVDVDPRNSEARQVLDRLLATPAPIPEAIPASAPDPIPDYIEPVRDELASLDFDVVNLSAVESMPVIPEEHVAPPADEDFMVQSFAIEPLEVPVVEEAAGPILWTPAPPELVVEPEPESSPEVFEFVAPHEQYVHNPEPEPASVPEPVVAEAAFPEPVAEPQEIEVFAAPAVVEAPEAFEPVEFVEEAASAEAVFDFVDETPAPEPVTLETIALVEEPTVEEYASFVDAPIAAPPLPEPVLELAPEPEPEPAVEVEPEPVVAEAVLEPEPAPEFHPEPVAGPVLIVTESMAELFLKQGHRELALAVYRQLLERSPDADHLRGSIARLEQELAPPRAPEPPPVVRQPYAAAETGGRSVERRLQAVLHAPPPSTASTVLPPAIEPGAEPTRASADSLSLAAVFGDEPAKGGRRDEDAAAPAGASEPSYDEFFGAGPTEPAAAPAPRGEGEDLRQFNEWLKGLKR